MVEAIWQASYNLFCIVGKCHIVGKNFFTDRRILDQKNYFLCEKEFFEIQNGSQLGRNDNPQLSF